MQDIKSKTAIITGASSGIGRQAARRLAAEGMRLALVGRSRARLEPLMAELGGGHAIVTADLTFPSEADRMVQAAEAALGRVDVLFANAGLYLPGNITETEPGAIEELINVNVTAVFRAVRAALPGMIAHGGGDIVVTSSVSGHQAIHWEPVYSASKHAVQAFVHGVRRQVSGRGVRVGSLAPGIVFTELWGEMDSAEVEAKVAARAGLRPEDVAEALVFMLRQPANATIRDLVILPADQDI